MSRSIGDLHGGRLDVDLGKYRLNPEYYSGVYVPIRRALVYEILPKVGHNIYSYVVDFCHNFHLEISDD